MCLACLFSATQWIWISAIKMGTSSPLTFKAKTGPNDGLLVRAALIQDTEEDADTVTPQWHQASQAYWPTHGAARQEVQRVAWHTCSSSLWPGGAERWRTKQSRLSPPFSLTSWHFTTSRLYTCHDKLITAYNRQTSLVNGQRPTPLPLPYSRPPSQGMPFHVS